MMHFTVTLVHPEDQQAKITITMTCKNWCELRDALDRCKVEPKEQAVGGFHQALAPATDARKTWPIWEFLAAMDEMLRTSEATIRGEHTFEIL